jgi:hypothetical protein
MKPNMSTDLKFIIGCFWGIINPGLALQIPFGNGEKEDYIRCIMMWEMDHKMLRINHCAVVTSTYKTPGGLNSGDRTAREKVVVEMILRQWGQYVRINKRRKGPNPELLFIKQKK